eukprot:TRINITY_DN1708_c0_g1_i1.p1 TRINITY_DN1708_c0_g1~~TRINITY_DN1708_c0_g1_i1.p1  ORF type:complete len:473 (-),score=89.95 TRINITY_DN1708_c0_g1_i1:30-1421(-)
MKSLLVLCVLSLISVVFSATPDEWKGKIIYQVLTDRFAGPSSSSCNLGNYCGGSFKGIQDRLDYIQGMGFNAIWISPIVQNTAGGYHGYWAQDLYQINSHFGTEEDLMNLIAACHSKQIAVMVDVVANHMGPVNYDYSHLVPFNDASHFHNCNNCPSNCQIQDYTNQNQVELCRLSGLPDLNQSNEYVANTLTSWIANMTSFYKIDGLRIDTIPEVDISFWPSFQQAANVYAVGEVYDGSIPYVANYQNAIDGVLSYPLFFTLRSCFQSQQSLNNLQSTLQQYASSFKDLDLLGTFIDNQDQARFLNGNSDYKLYSNAITYVLMAQGIPIIYYGTEQGFSGANDPNNREILWPTGYATSNSLYKLITTLNGVRMSENLSGQPQIQRYSDDNFYAFSRGTTFVALTNVGQNNPQISRTITYHPYSNGQTICNVFWPTSDCITISGDSFVVYLDNGESKVYVLQN